MPHLHAAPLAEQQPEVTGYTPDAITAEAPDDLYYWGGYLFNHYGHFIVGSLARLWMLPRLKAPRPKILYWGDSADHVLAQPFARELLATIGLARDDFVTFAQPTRVREIIVAETSFEENHCVNGIYGRFMRRIGDSLAPGPYEMTDRPAYISKANLAGGTAHTVNEGDFAERLSRAGVDIFYPEQHSIAEQVRLWRSRTLISGFLGSAMLTAAFAGRKTVAILNHEPQVYSNQVLMDRMNDNVSTYHYPHEDIVDLGPNDKFHFNFSLRDPVATAEEFLRVIDGLQHGPSRARRRTAVAASVGTMAYVDDPLGINLSRFRPARTSSILPPHSRRKSIAGDAGEAVDGTLDHGYGFHTALEQDPWWSVDLGQNCDIHEVRLFNCVGPAAINSCHLRILLSADGHVWDEVHRRVSDEPFGGSDGRPYRWQPDRPLSAQHVRVQLLATTHFHLHEVEVFGDVVLSPSAPGGADAGAEPAGAAGVG